MGFFFLLRRSEYLRIGQARHFYCLKHQNVFFSDAEGKPTPESKATSVTIGLEGAKNDQFGRGTWRTMHPSGDPVICPVIPVKHVNIVRRMDAYKGRYLCGNLTAATMAEAFKTTAKRSANQLPDPFCPDWRSDSPSQRPSEQYGYQAPGSLDIELF
ncbi:LOW QUALITY PROTEIN: hypothetical protein PHMEG_00017253 [Phytophthora megakarya]|uniref:Uncharacterized protein n=1 Tax=Phytophthora megakarya TaxID=4795 RepID=A0A225VWQ2_9STRA|nr:LOW QUALITY PROTEIN: hypothetical protein PHMEG_00017253 [Phytophthora megakarya]